MHSRHFPEEPSKGYPYKDRSSSGSSSSRSRSSALPKRTSLGNSLRKLVGAFLTKVSVVVVVVVRNRLKHYQF